jgi:hypothetical protein
MQKANMKHKINIHKHRYTNNKVPSGDFENLYLNTGILSKTSRAAILGT